ncbi:unnamed protein product [Calicophoron daubneyi]|uniref:RNA helicase n=1 Tax=Calicophoron daubneyi TaxID=300641 RepID=A0AAV2TYS0_CALDB
MEIPDDDVPLGIEVKRNVVSRTRKREKRVTSDRNVVKFRKLHGIRMVVGGSVLKSTSTFSPPVLSFDQPTVDGCALNEVLRKNLEELSYLSPTPIQAQAIPVLMKRRNLLACAPTGSGKTAAYLLPLLDEYFAKLSSSTSVKGRELPLDSDTIKKADTEGGAHKVELFAIILAPTQELVRQIWSEAVRLSRNLSSSHFVNFLTRHHYSNRGKEKLGKVRTITMASNTSGSEKLVHKHREQRLPRSTRVLISTPSRMGFLLSLEPSLCPFDLSRLSWLIIDECDKMLETDFKVSHPNGPTKDHSFHRCRSFRDQMMPIFGALKMSSPFESESDLSSEPHVYPGPVVALFSATVPDEVAEWARTELPQILPGLNEAPNFGECTNFVELRVGKRNSAVSTVKQELRYCATEEGKLLEIKCMLSRGLSYPCLIFMESRERAKDIVKEILLSDADILVNVISSDKTEAQRAGVIRAFRKGQLNVLVCTDLLGRGIDFKGVNMVVNYDLPPSKQEYIHRVGRTGRAGQTGKAVTFWTDADLPHLGEILKVMRRSGSEVDSELERLVGDWQLRRTQLVTSRKRKRKADDQPVATNISAVAFTRRRGERRLIHKVLERKKSSSVSGHNESADTQKYSAGLQKSAALKWVRPWNPYRKPIRQLAGARAGNGLERSLHQQKKRKKRNSS